MVMMKELIRESCCCLYLQQTFGDYHKKRHREFIARILPKICCDFELWRHCEASVGVYIYVYIND